MNFQYRVDHQADGSGKDREAGSLAHGDAYHGLAHGERVQDEEMELGSESPMRQQDQGPQPEKFPSTGYSDLALAGSNARHFEGGDSENRSRREKKKKKKSKERESKDLTKVLKSGQF